MAFITWNPSDKSPRITLSGGNLVATADGTANYEAVRATGFRTTGKWYCEITITSNGALVGSCPRVGLCTSAYDLITNFGDATTHFVYGANGNKLNNTGGGAGVVYGATYTTGDIISIVYDGDLNTLTFWKNGVSQGEAFAISPQALAVTFFDVGGSVGTANFGASAFAYTPPADHLGWFSETNDLDASFSTVMTLYGMDALDASIPAPVMALYGGNTLEMSIPAPVMMLGNNMLEVILPAPVMELGTGSTLEATLAPVLAMSDGDSFMASIPAPAFSMTGESTLSSLSVSASFLFEASGATGATASFEIGVPAPVLQLATPAELNIEVSFGASFSAIGGAVGQFAAELPFPQFTAASLSENLLTFAAQFAPRFSVATQSENLGSFALTLPRIRFGVSGYAGSVASFAAAYFPEAALSGYGPYEGTMVLSYPPLVLDLEVVSAIAAGTRTWVLNLHKRGLTEYDNFAFNSYATLHGVVLSAGNAGLFRHAEQNTDSGSKIAAVVRTGEESFGTSFNKRVPRIYVGYKTDGAMKFATITSQDGKRVYLLPDNEIRGVQQRRVPVGRGPKSPYWQFEMTNVEGADFLIEHMHVYPEKSTRRVV